MSEERIIVFVIGTSYCGSSLLNLLLDNQPRVRGLGEAVNLATANRRAHCMQCERTLPECAHFGRIQRGRFYRSLFELYGDCDVLVDSSKSFWGCLDTHPFEPEFEHRVILLSKAPHEFAYSWMGHHRETSPAGAFRRFVDFYNRELDRLAVLPWFQPWDLLTMTYRDLVTKTEGTLERVCEFLGKPFGGVSGCWETDTHIAGGNLIVAAQVQRRWHAFSRAGAGYLEGKYGGKYRRIFYDGHWREDAAFVDECLALYEQRRGELEPLLLDLEQLDVRQQVADVVSCAAARS